MQTNYEISRALREVNRAWLDLLYQRAAQRLTGRKCRVEWQCSLDRVRGLALKDGDIAIVQVRGDLPAAQKFEVFLHECAHHVLHHDGLADICQLSQVLEVKEQRTGQRAAPEWLMSSRKRAHDERESQAAQLAGTWLARVSNIKGEQDKLIALMDMSQNVAKCHIIT